MKKLFILIFLFGSLTLTAQDKYEITDQDYENSQVEIADVMRSNGKIYVVVAVVATIFAGLIVFMVNTDRKISRLEKEFLDEKG